MHLEEVLAKLNGLSPDDRKAVVDIAIKATKDLKFVPNPGAQTDAYFSQADVLLYGGAAGGGKSSLLVGLAADRHQRSLILRRETVELDGLISESRKMLSEHGTYNGSDKEWTYEGGRSLKFGGMKEPDDWRKYAGRARDFIGFDEAGEFIEDQVSSIMAWLRSTDNNQRCRAVLASNPPRTVDGRWMLKWFAPWIEPNFPYPAKPGELRWAVVIDDERKWVDGPEPVIVAGERYSPLSYTFVPATLDANPFLGDDYRRRLENQAGPLRAQLLHGDFAAGHEDQDWQVIPTAWIVAAQARWKPDGYKDFAMTAMGFDPAGGGADAAELCWRHNGWYAPLITVKGEETANGSEAAGRIIAHRRDSAPVIVDVGGGYGGAVTLRLKDNGIAHLGFNGANQATSRTKDGQLSFANKRAEAWWRFKEELDPDQEGGSAICLPPDSELRADLAAPTYEVGTRGILIENKDDIRKRLGRSPGKGDAVVMCLSQGNAARRQWLNGKNVGQAPKVNLGYSNLKKRRF